MSRFKGALDLVRFQQKPVLLAAPAAPPPIDLDNPEELAKACLKAAKAICKLMVTSTQASLERPSVTSVEFSPAPLDMGRRLAV